MPTTPCSSIVCCTFVRPATPRAEKPRLGSGGWRATGTLKLERAGVDGPLVAAAFADDASTREEIVRIARRRAAAEIGGAIERVVYVGDAVWDVRTCRHLAVPFIGIARDERAQILRREGADRILPDLSHFDAFRAALEEAQVPSRPRGREGE